VEQESVQGPAIQWSLDITPAKEQISRSGGDQRVRIVINGKEFKESQ